MIVNDRDDQVYLVMSPWDLQLVWSELSISCSGTFFPGRSGWTHPVFFQTSLVLQPSLPLPPIPSSLLPLTVPPPPQFSGLPKHANLIEKLMLTLLVEVGLFCLLAWKKQLVALRCGLLSLQETTHQLHWTPTSINCFTVWRYSARGFYSSLEVFGMYRRS